MPSTVEQLSPTRVKITVEVPFADLKPSMDKAYAEIAKSVNIPGFRRGKVPPMVTVFAVTPGVWAAPPNAPGTVSASAATRPTPHTMSFRTDLPPCGPSEFLPVSRERTAGTPKPLQVETRLEAQS